MQLTQLVLDGVADGPVGLAFDIMGAASRLSKRAFGVRLVSIDGAPVRTAANRALAVDGALGRVSSRDLLVLPGLGMATPAAIEAGLAREDFKRAARAVARAATSGAWVGASCSATFVLATSGVLDGLEATTTWWLSPTFAERFPQIILRADRMVARSGRIFTAGSAFGHADLLLAMLSSATSPSLAQLVARYLLLDERASQARYMVLEHIRTADPVVRVLEQLINRNLGRTLSLDEMAHATGTSPRTLARRVERALGTTPLRFAQRLRVAHAAHLLETTTRSVDDVAARVGYVDAAAFRRVFRRELGESPRERRAGGTR